MSKPLQFNNYNLVPVMRTVDGDKECAITDEWHSIAFLGIADDLEDYVRIADYQNVPQALDVFARVTGSCHDKHFEFIHEWNKTLRAA